MKINKKLSYSFLYNIANALFPLATLPFVFRAISPATYGNIVFSNLIYQVLIALFFNSLISFSIREYQKNKRKSIEDIYNLQILFTIISVVLYYLLSVLFGFLFHTDDDYMYIFLACTCFSFLSSDWILFSEQDYKKLLIRTICVKGMLLVGVFLFVNNERDGYLYALMLSAGYISNNVMAFYYVRKYYDVKINISIKSIKERIFDSRYFLSSATVGISYQYVDQLIVGVLLNSSSLAYLNVLKQIIGMLSIVPNTICRFYLPKASLVYLNKDKIKEYHKSLSVKYFLVIFLSFITILSFGQYALSLFLGEKFEISDNSMKICSMIYIFSAISVYLDTQHSVPLGYEKITFRANVIVASFYLLPLYWVANSYNYNGVLFSLALAEFLGIVYIVLFYLRRKEIWLK